MATTTTQPDDFRVVFLEPRRCNMKECKDNLRRKLHIDEAVKLYNTVLTRQGIHRLRKILAQSKIEEVS